MRRPCLVSTFRPHDYLGHLERSSALASRTAALDLDATRALLPSGLGHRHRKHPILEARLHLLKKLFEEQGPWQVLAHLERSDEGRNFLESVSGVPG